MRFPCTTSDALVRVLADAGRVDGAVHDAVDGGLAAAVASGLLLADALVHGQPVGEEGAPTELARDEAVLAEVRGRLDSVRLFNDDRDEAVGDPSLTSTAAGDVGRLSSGGLSFH